MELGMVLPNTQERKCAPLRFYESRSAVRYPALRTVNLLRVPQSSWISGLSGSMESNGALGRHIELAMHRVGNVSRHKRVGRRRICPCARLTAGHLMAGWLEKFTGGRDQKEDLRCQPIVVVAPTLPLPRL
jgi:hypothetical protein